MIPLMLGSYIVRGYLSHAQKISPTPLIEKRRETKQEKATKFLLAQRINHHWATIIKPLVPTHVQEGVFACVTKEVAALPQHTHWLSLFKVYSYRGLPCLFEAPWQEAQDGRALMLMELERGVLARLYSLMLYGGVGGVVPPMVQPRGELDTDAYALTSYMAPAAVLAAAHQKLRAGMLAALFSLAALAAAGEALQAAIAFSTKPVRHFDHAPSPASPSTTATTTLALRKPAFLLPALTLQELYDISFIYFTEEPTKSKANIQCGIYEYQATITTSTSSGGRVYPWIHWSDGWTWRKWALDIHHGNTRLSIYMHLRNDHCLRHNFSTKEETSFLSWEIAHGEGTYHRMSWQRKDEEVVDLHGADTKYSFSCEMEGRVPGETPWYWFDATTSPPPPPQQQQQQQQQQQGAGGGVCMGAGVDVGGGFATGAGGLDGGEGGDTSAGDLDGSEGEDDTSDVEHQQEEQQQQQQQSQEGAGAGELDGGGEEEEEEEEEEEDEGYAPYPPDTLDVAPLPTDTDTTLGRGAACTDKLHYTFAHIVDDPACNLMFILSHPNDATRKELLSARVFEEMCDLAGSPPTTIDLGPCVGKGNFSSTYEAGPAQGLAGTKCVKVTSICSGDMSVVGKRKVHNNAVAATRELLALAKLMNTDASPYMVPFYGAYMWRGQIFLVMDFMEEGSMAQFKRKLTEEQCHDVLGLALSAIHQLHGQGVAHLDIKADNLFFDSDGHILLSDLNCGLIYQPGYQFWTREPRGAICAPEVLDGMGHGWQADLYALGVTIRELALGESMESWENAELRAFVEGLCADNPSVRPTYDDWVARGLARE